ncbi:MAG: lipase family protein, partial [Leptospiraceae bacterium]|nr:lipase family protein [Leptospiraceae bacterium]
ENDLWVIARGTEPTSFDDWMTDLKFRESNIKQVRFHQGFHNSAQALLNSIVNGKKLIELIEELSKKKRKIYFAGHSLGGALAIYFSWYLTKNYDHKGNEKSPIIPKDKVFTYTFGAPNVGNKELSNEIDSHTYRIVYNQDIVARIPNFLNYKPAGKLFYIKEDGEITNPSDIPDIDELIIHNIFEFKNNPDIGVLLKFGVFTPFVKLFLNHSMEYYCYFLKKELDRGK